MDISINDISVRSNLKPGDLGYIIYLHGKLYNEEYNFGIGCDIYIAEGICEFYRNYDPARDRVWVCEHKNKIIGFLLLMHRDNVTAQLRYFIITPEYRGIGLGKKLMELYMEFFHECGYKASYLWTTSDLNAAAALYKRHGFRLTEQIETLALGRLVTEQRYDL